jgi:copper resistance protein B
MNHATMQGMDHSKMNQGSAVAPPMNHTMSSMQGGVAPTDARDPHAYAEGYNFGAMPHMHMGDSENFAALIIDRLETIVTNNSNFMTYDWQAWAGQTYDRVVVRAEGSLEDGAFTDARNELLWGHALTPYWDSQLGLRYDSGKGSDRPWFALGVQGLAPYWLYVEATAYVGEDGRAALRLETEYDLLITQRLILQPRVEFNIYSQRDDSRQISSGLADVESGVRLRYEIRREFAPYIGVEWAGKFGSAADNLRASGKQAEETRLVAGVHIWF